MSHSTTLGERLRVLRRARKLSTTQLAQRVAISPSYVQKLESGARKAGPDLLASLSQALRCPPEALSGAPALPRDEERSQRDALSLLPRLRRLMLCHEAPEDLDRAPRPLPVLAAEVDRIAAARRDGRYLSSAPALPAVLRELTHTALTATAEDEARAAYRHLARTYRAVNSLAHKTGHHDLSLTALDRVRWAAARSGDPLLETTAGYLLAGAMLREGAHEAAHRRLTALRTALRRTRPERTAPTAEEAAVDGALLLKLAAVETRRNALLPARAHLREAAEISRRAGDRDSQAYETFFGPTNIRIHQVHVLVGTGEPERALAALRQWGDDGQEEWSPPTGTPGERAARHHLEVATARLATGDRTGAFAELGQARRIAPNLVRYHRHAQETAAALIRLDRHPANELTAFGQWAGITGR
ncbi:helix-turn-helix domain-containing protein [Streptomyces sp. NPDC059740]|uniref:helix-turn-helix domain-containing protein n=1 Tax=Streptomyces sp. NPDC059740 TaxID=3346926 RepID=UPI003653C63C